MADNNGIKLLKYFLQKLKSFFLSKDILSFLLFLALSSGFWFVHALGKERETTISIPVSYVGIPQNIIITNSPPSEIKINVKDQGLKLLEYSRNKVNPLTIDLKRTFYQKGEILITSDQLVGRLNRYLQPTTAILDIHPDSLFVRYEKLESKTVPIALVSSIELAHQHVLSSNTLLEPAQVTVFGPKRIIDSLKSVQTEKLILKNLSDTTVVECKLRPVKSVRFSDNTLKVTLFVEQFTEKSVQIPVTYINCPDHLSIKTFPAVVNATYTVGLSHFNSFNPDDVQVYLDYNDLRSSKLSKQRLKVLNNAQEISNLKIVPSEVEFILEEK